MKWKSILAIGLAAFLPNTMVSAEILEVDAVGEYTAGKNEIVRSYEQLLYKTPPEDLTLDAIEKLQELDPQGYSSNYFLYHYYLAHDDDQRALESAKQGIRKIRNTYSPEQIKKFTTVVVEFPEVDTDFDFPEYCIFDLYAACFGFTTENNRKIDNYGTILRDQIIAYAYSEEEV